MKTNLELFFIMIALIAVMAAGVVLFISIRTSVISLDPGIEYDAIHDPAFDVNAGFAVNPYQAGNSDQKLAVMITASVSYILREVKSFAMFVVILTVLALTAYVTAVYFVLHRIAKPTVNTAETRKDISDKKNGGDERTPDTNCVEGTALSQIDSVTGNNAVMGHSSIFNDNIEEQISNIAYLSVSIDEMLSNIDSAIERSKVKQRVLL